MKPHALVTNDDGIDSAFLHRLVDALHGEFQISVVAPASEQSWIGRAISRRKEVEVADCSSIFPESVQAWSVTGTPTDCVNIALGHLIDHPVDIVLSGINIGYNTAETLILRAREPSPAPLRAPPGAFPQLHLANQFLHHLFDSIWKNNGRTEGPFTDSLLSSAQHACRIALETHENPPVGNKVVNVNFPDRTAARTPTEETVPAKIKLGSFYKKNDAGNYEFHFPENYHVERNKHSDQAVLERGNISIGILDFSRIGVRNAENLKLAGQNALFTEDIS